MDDKLPKKKKPVAKSGLPKVYGLPSKQGKRPRPRP